MSAANHIGGTVLEVAGLQTFFFTRAGILKAVDDVSFSLKRGETLAVVGESGCGKSMTALSIMRLVPNPPGRIVGGAVTLDGRDLLQLNEAAMRNVRGNEVSMIFQEPMTSLNPVLTIGEQIGEAIRLHQNLPKSAAMDKAVEMLRLVRIPEPAQRAREYPHQLSGGMRQRAMIAIALACNPKVLIADEPTTALDVTIQAQILDLILELQRELGTALILITHDLGIVAETAQRVIVMYAGRKVEEADVEALFALPLHPYTSGLMASIPRLPSMRDKPAEAGARLTEIPGMVPGLTNLPAGCVFAPRCALADQRCRAEYPSYEEKQPGHWAACWHSARLAGGAMPETQTHAGGATPRAGPAPVPVLEVTGLKKHFPVKKGILGHTVGQVLAVDDVSISIGEGETLGLVGESGCGKSTVARAVLRLVEPTAGSIRLCGTDITHLGKAELRPHRREMQIVFQDPFASLDPRMSAGDIVGEPLMAHGIAKGQERAERVAALFQQVGLQPVQMRGFPHEFSGGQRQRICIARALALSPKLIVCDEPVSGLDVSIQAQVINLMVDLQQEKRLSYLFIAHDLAVVEHISHRIAVMYLGRIVEYADKETLFRRPLHPYTEALLAAVPIPDPKIRRQKRVLQGDVPSPVNPPSGCVFHTRCPYVMARCKEEAPRLTEIAPGNLVACHLHEAGA